MTPQLRQVGVFPSLPHSGFAGLADAADGAPCSGDAAGCRPARTTAARSGSAAAAAVTSATGAAQPWSRPGKVLSRVRSDE